MYHVWRKKTKIAQSFFAHFQDFILNCDIVNHLVEKYFWSLIKDKICQTWKNVQWGSKIKTFCFQMVTFSQQYEWLIL